MYDNKLFRLKKWKQYINELNLENESAKAERRKE